MTAIDEARLTELLDAGMGPKGQSEDAHFGLQLAVAAHHQGELVFERYGTTAGPETALISWSMAKSIGHALVGLLVADGCLDPTAPAPVPRWSDDERSQITLQHLLEMNSGLEFVEDYIDDQVSHVIEMLFGAGKDDVAAYAESFPLLHPPGTVFNYSSGTSNIVSAICARAIADAGGGTGAEAIERFLRTRLFDPIGMGTASITCDPSGTFIASSFVHAPAREFLRFGQLYLNDGVWQGERLLPEGWAAHARRPVATPVTDSAHWYGAHWWLWDENCPTGYEPGLDCSDINGFAAHGYEGQYTLVVPDRDLVLVRLGKTPVDNQPQVRQWLADIVRCFPVTG